MSSDKSYTNGGIVPPVNPDAIVPVFHAQSGLAADLEWIKKFGVTISPDELKQEMRKTAVSFNHGRARKVSLDRPSPWLSKEKLAALRTQARFNLIVRCSNG